MATSMSDMNNGSLVNSLKGYLPPASALAGAEPVDLNGIAFKPIIPHKYLALLGHMREQRSLWQVDNKKEDSSSLEALEKMLVAHQRQRIIDNHKITLQLNGRSTEISQGDLRSIMEKRLRELKERRRNSAGFGTEADNDLIERYEHAIKDLEEGKADADTINKVEQLMKDDPPLERKIQGDGNTQAVDQSKPTGSYSTSFAADFDRGGIQAESISRIFSDSAAGITLDSKEVQPPTQEPKVSQAFEAYGI